MDRIGIALWNFEGDPIGNLRMFVGMGYTAVSINGKLLDTFGESQEQEILRIATQSDIIFTFHGGLTNDEGASAQRRAIRILKWQECTGRVACVSYDTPRIHTPDGVKRADPEPILPIFREMLELFAGTGIRIALEDCPIDADHLQHLGALQDQYPHAGVLVDLGHMNLRLRERARMQTEPTRQEINAYLNEIPWEIVELHVHSNDGTRDQHAPPYFPNADLPSAACTLRDMGFSGISTIEIAPRWCGLTADEAIPAAAKSLEYWRHLIERSKT